MGKILDVLVKLAALGTSGICIFGIFWVGYIISKESDPQKYEILKFYMILCFAIAIISAATNIYAMRNDKKQVAGQVKEVNATLKMVVETKGEFLREHPSEELGRYVDQLKKTIARFEEYFPVQG